MPVFAQPSRHTLFYIHSLMLICTIYTLCMLRTDNHGASSTIAAAAAAAAATSLLVCSHTASVSTEVLSALHQLIKPLTYIVLLLHHPKIVRPHLSHKNSWLSGCREKRAALHRIFCRGWSFANLATCNLQQHWKWLLWLQREKRSIQQGLLRVLRTWQPSRPGMCWMGWAAWPLLTPSLLSWLRFRYGLFIAIMTHPCI